MFGMCPCFFLRFDPAVYIALRICEHQSNISNQFLNRKEPEF